MRRVFNGIVVLALIVMSTASLGERAGAAENPAPALGVDLRLTAESNGTRIDLSTPAYAIETVARDQQTFQQIVVKADGWTSTGAVGAPALPERGLLVAAPPTGEISLEVLQADWQPVSGIFNLLPQPTSTLVGDGEDTRLEQHWAMDARAYAAAGWTPSTQAEITQEGWFRGYRFVRVALRPFRFNAGSGELQAALSMQVRVTFAQPAPAAVAAPLDPLFAPTLQQTFANYDQAAGWQTRPAPQAMPEGAASRLVDPYVKLTVNADGLYEVTYAALQTAGVSATTLNTLNPRTFRLLDQNQEQSIYVIGEADGVFNPTDSLMFYGRRNTAAYSSDDNVYWLTWGGANGVRMTRQSAPPGGASLPTTLLTSSSIEQNLEYKPQRPFTEWLQPSLYDHWYWSQIVLTKTLTFPDLKLDAASTTEPVLDMWMAGDRESAGDYKVEFKFNGGSTVSKNWTQVKILNGTLTLPTGLLVNGSNTVVLKPINLSGLPDYNYTVWLDWLSLTYPYNATFLSNGVFYNPTAGLWRYQITNVPHSSPWILNVATPTAPKLLINATATGAGPYTISWQQVSAATDRFLVVPPSEVRQPAAIAVFTPSTLLDTTQQVDYLMVVHPSLLAAVQLLVDMHTAQGLSVRVVTPQEIYDAFSDGSVSADAIRSYFSYAYSNYQAPAPTYVLLVGDGSVNFRSYPLSGVTLRANLIPSYFAGFDSFGGTTFSDNALVRVQGNDLLGEMVISRLPVNDANEATVVVNKITAYASTFPQGRALNTLWVSDNPDSDNPGAGTQFYIATAATMAPLQPQFQVDRVYWCVPGTNVCPTDPWVYTDITAARAAIVSKWNQGHVLLHYTGHGGITTWAHEQLFRGQWVGQLNNGAALPFLLVSSCTNGYFVSPRSDGIDETLLRTAGRGTIGGFTGVTFDTLEPQTTLLTRYLEAVMDDGITGIGMASATARARAYSTLPYPDNEHAAVGHGLTGDPALVLVKPDACAVGDVNCDGVIDIIDVQLVAALWNAVAWTPQYNPRADLVLDGHIDIADIIAVAELWHTAVE